MKPGNVYSFFSRGLWLADLTEMGRPKAVSYKALRLFAAAVREVIYGKLGLHATSFVYTTLLSIVPLVAVSFSVLKAFGVHNLAEPLLRRFLAPLGEAGDVITARIIEFVGNIKVGVLGTLGLLFLLYTVVSLVSKMEDALNEIWRVKESRSIGRRFGDYISIILVGPVMLFTAMGLTAAVKSAGFVRALIAIGPVGTFFYYLGHLIPFITVCIAFVFIYKFIPNTHVRLSAALFGGVFAGVLWEGLGRAFTTFVVTSAKYSAIYSSFAILVVFMLWLYYSWLTFLVGAVVSFYFQHPEYMAVREGQYRLSGSGSEELAAAMMLLVGDSHYYGKAPWGPESLARKLALPEEPVKDIVRVLKNAGFLAEAGPDAARYLLPARDIETIKIKDVLKAVRKAGHEVRPLGEAAPAFEAAGEVEKAIGGALGEETVKDLVIGPGKEQQEKKAA